MEVPEVEVEAALQVEVGREIRVLLGLIVRPVIVAAGRHPMLALDMFLAVHRGLHLVLLHLINLIVVWTWMEHRSQLCIYL
jgi:hypothetical protein